jgi:hypothetical protein
MSSFNSMILGGGSPNGFQSKGGLIGGGANSNSGSGMVGSGERSTDRQVLRRAFGNQVMPNLYGLSPILYNKGASPFRLAFSAGDVMGKVNEAANPKYGQISNQVNGITRVTALGGYRSVADGIRYGNAAYCGNPRRVYDSSDYVRYRKLRAENKNYNDSNYGGDAHHSTQTAYNLTRH